MSHYTKNKKNEIYQNHTSCPCSLHLLTGVAAACSDDTPAGEDNSTEQGGNGATDKDNPDNNGNSDADNSDSSEYPTPDRSAIAAFPGAEGAGKYTPAARAVLSMW